MLVRISKNLNIQKIFAVFSRRKARHRLNLNYRHLFITTILSLIIFSCTNTSKSDLSTFTISSSESPGLKVWWDKGFNLEEDEALQKLIGNWEKQTGKEIKLSLHTNDELPRKLERAFKSDNIPDVLISYNAHTEIIPRLAWEGKLADISDVIEPIKNLYPDTMLQAVDLYNKITKKRSYHAIPIHQATIHIFYWRDLLKQVGRTESDIPKDWDGFWEFWKQIQDKLQTQQKEKIYALGFPFSIGASDTYYLFEQVLEAYDVTILDSQGQLLVDRSDVRQGIIKSLEWYAKFYQQGYIPLEAMNWLDPDNNRNLLNRALVMTPNVTLSIPVAVRQDPDTYFNKLGILEFPHKPSGKPMRYLVILKEAVLFADSKKQKIAKDFLAYLSQPQVTRDYLKAAGGRYLPIIKPVWKDPAWKNPTDPYISTAAKTLIDGETRLYYSAQNPAYTTVMEENVWGKALNRIVMDGIIPEQAADEAIARIKQIFAQWR